MTARLRRMGPGYAGFTAIALVPGLATLAALTVVARHSTVLEWSALGVGGSVGGVLALVVLYGWRLSGPVEVARATSAGRRTIYAQSMADRLALFLVAAVPSGLVAALVSPPGVRLLTCTMVLAGALTGLSGLWYAVGVNDPWLCLRREAVPRVLGSLAGAGAVAVGGPVWLLPVGVGVGTLVGASYLTGRVLGGDTRLVLTATRGVLRSLRRTGRGALSEIAGGAYSAGCVALVGVAAAAPVTALFSSGDRCFRAALIPVSALSSSLQRGVSQSAGPAFDSARARAFRAHLVLGVVGGALIAVIGSDASRVLFGAELAVPATAARGFAVAFVAVSLNTTLGRHVLASQGRLGAILAGTLTGVLIGVPAILWGTAEHGVTGAAWGLAVGEVAVLAAYALAVVRPGRSAG